MRPSILFPLFAEIRTLAGGPKLEKLIAKVRGAAGEPDFDLPVGVIDGLTAPS